MTSATYTAIARRREEQGMTSTCRIVERTRSRDPNPATGKHDEHDRVVYVGPCEYVAGNTQVRELASAGRDLSQQAAILKLPVDASGADRVRSGHIAFVANPDDDRELEARIAGDHSQTLAVSRRFPVEVTASG